MYKPKTCINNGEPCVQREYAAESVYRDRQCSCTVRVRCMKMLLTHVLGHNFGPLAFQKPRLGLLTEETALYIFRWVSARSRPFGRDKYVT